MAQLLIQEQQHQHEHELFLDTLKRLWSHYLNATIVPELLSINNSNDCIESQHALEHERVKQHWLQLFLYNLQFLDEQITQTEDFKSFFNPIPEEICSYLLEQVYQIISASKILTQTTNNELSVSEGENVSKEADEEVAEHERQRKKHNFTQLILSTPSDCNKIIALRTFLTNDLGQHLLEFLLKVDIKLIASQKSLCHLCINLFPNCNWSESIEPLKHATGINEFISNLNLNIRSPKSKKQQQQHQQQQQQQQSQSTISPIPCQLYITPYISSAIAAAAPIKDFTSFKNSTKTSDDIALLLIQLLTKCVLLERDSSFSTQALSLIVHKFALGCLCTTTNIPSHNCDDDDDDDDHSDVARRNDEIIKFELLQLIAQCMNNFCANEDSPNVLDFNSSLSELLYALAVNREHTQLAYAILQIMFAMLHNLVEMLSKRRNHHRDHHQYACSSNNKLNVIDAQKFDTCFVILKELLERQANSIPNEEEPSTQLIFTQIYKTLLRLTQNLACYEQDLGSNSIDSNGVQKPPSRSRKRHIAPKQLHCCTLFPSTTTQQQQQEQQQQGSLACYFQRKIFQLLPRLSSELQEYSMLYLLRNGSCCCHYNLPNYATCLRLATQIGASSQKCAYKFLHKHILSTLFVRTIIEQSPNSNSSTKHHISPMPSHCLNCDEKLNSQSFHIELLRLYEESYKSMPPNDTLCLLLFLKHLKQIANLLANDLAAGIMAEIVLPIFRRHKVFILVSTESNKLVSPKTNKSPSSPTKLNLLISNNARVNGGSQSLLQECLSIFVMYLRDIRLIKAFYNEENIKHMEDLLSIPELQRGVCDLIKVGIDNISYLGDSSHEQRALSQRLITLQLNSSDHAARLFHTMLMRVVGKSSRSSSTPRVGTKFWLDESFTLNSLAGHKPADILYITALQWTLNYELLKTSQLFYNEFAKIYSIDSQSEENDEEDPFDLKSLNSNGSKVSSFNLRYGDKTIIDILKLNYNALSCFLMLPDGEVDVSAQTANAKETSLSTITTNQHNITATDTNTNKSNDSFCHIHSSSLEAIVSNVPLPPSIIVVQPTSALHMSSLEASAVSTGTASSSSSFDFESLDYSMITTNYTPENSSDSFTFLQYLQNTPKDESIVLFDIKNQSDVEGKGKGKLPPRQLRFDTVTHNKSSCSTTTAAQQQSNEGVDETATEQAGIIDKLFSAVGSFFTSGSSGDGGNGNTNTNTSLELSGLEIDNDLYCLYEPNSECKKLLLKLFEATMAISIKGYQNEEVEKMQKHLRKLKAIILSNADTNWSEHGEQNVRDNSIIQALQTLLKIAELSHTLNEPAAIVSSSTVLTTTTTTEDAPTQQMNTTTTTTPRTRARSLNSSNGVEFPKLRISTQLPAKNSIATPQTPKRPISGESGDADYFSTRASLACGDSELEFSENEYDYYLTADEGYEADGEIPEITDSEYELAMTYGNGTNGAVDIWHGLQPISRYRSHIMHDGLCRLVVDILIELSEQCTLNPTGVWADSLSQLANRLFVIRHYLGGPLFLLRGFMPVLSCNDARLKELQQSVLDLVTQLNTPDVLNTYFSILSTKEPPMDILIKFMHHVSINALKKAQPSAELEFPMITDGKCISTADRQLSEFIDRIRHNHMQCQATTPFTRAPCFLPVTHTRLWHNDGCTVSLWMEMKTNQQNQRNSMQFNEEELRCYGEDITKTHIVSLGTNQAMLSVYVNNNMQLVLEMCKPNAEMPAIQRNNTQNATIATAAGTAGAAAAADVSIDALDVTATTNAEPKESLVNSKRNRSSNHRNHNKYNKQQQLVDAMTPQTNGNDGHQSPLRQALKQTKQVLINSFNHMHFLNGHHHHQSTNAESDSYFEVSNVELKNLRLARNKWIHLVLAIDNQPDRLDITMYLDGLEQHTSISLPFPNFRLLTRSHIFQVLALGDSVSPRNNGNQNFSSESHSTQDLATPRFSIANLILFNRKITLKDCILNLTALGPDFTEFTQCQVANWKPNYGYLNLPKMTSANFGNFTESIKLLRQARVFTYTAQQPDMSVGYDSSQVELDHAAYGRPYGLILYGELLQNELQSLQTSTILCGGLSTLLYLFAKVVEVSSNAITQALALDLLLNVAHSETQLFTEFQRNDYISLIGYVIKSERCSKDVQLLKSIINNACTQPVICQKGDDVLYVNENTMSTIAYPRLIISTLHRYSDWHRSGAEQCHVLEMLFRSILALTREKHPHRDFNMEQLQKVGIVNELLNICKVYVIESPNPVYISKDAAESFVQILSTFAGSPPSPSLLDEIMKLLLLLQKPSECYITHDRSKFYFLLTPQSPIKERSTMAANLSRVTTPFRRNILRARSGVAVPTNANDSSNNTSDMDAKRKERIQRLRKLHMSLSTHKRSIHEFEEMLDTVADCSKLNKSALRVLDPIEASTWRIKYKRRSGSNLISASHKNKAKSSTPQNITHRRFRIQAACSGARCSQTSIDTTKHSLHSLQFVFDSENNDGGGGGGGPMQRHMRALQKMDFYSSIGIITLQEGLLALLKDFLCLLPDLAVDEVLRHYVKLEFLLVLGNHTSCAVRAAIVRLLAALTKRLPQLELIASFKNLYPLHLANQLSIHPTDAQMFEACIAWITGIYGNMSMILASEADLCIRQRFGLSALLAITSKINVGQAEFTECAFQVLKRIYINNPYERETLIEAGLLQCCMKALYNLYSPAIMNINNTKTEMSIICLLTAIGEKSLKSIGQINIIWDILNMLSFYQEKQQSAVIVRSFRAVQALLQLNWINMYFTKTNVPWSFKITTFSDSTLSQAECRTRLEMLIDRCSQFFTIYEDNSSPSDNEVKLFEFLVSYGISTNQRCNNFIAWGLQPSRPRDLRAYIVDALWISCQDDFQPAIICDVKMIKALLWLSLLEDLEKPIENLPLLCKSLGINEHASTWNLENELERIEMFRCSVSAKQKLLLEKTIFKFESLAQSCIDSSMVTTRRVAELQNAERKLLMSHMKDYDDTSTYTKWLEVIRRMTHEGAPWYCKERAESFWELDDTEGPSRVHTRLRRCHLDIDKRFFMEDYQNGNATKRVGCHDDYVRPLDYLISSYDQQLNISLNSQILYNFPAKFLPVDGDIDGEIIITDHKLYFLATYRCKYFNVNCDISNITEIWLKRYQHQEKAFEIFLDTNKSLFFSLQNQDDWKIMRDVFCDKIVSTPDSNKVQLFTQQWREGLLTNWEYLMTLNQIAGRTYNDLMQYPVFPWILNNYKTEHLDLTDANNFRKLEKPIAIQDPENELHYISNYTYINNTTTNMGSIILKPYHYSSHYSNSGTVLHFLVRVPPFTSYFLRYQDNNFDLPDRTFHDVGTTWCLASRDSPTDVKELIPEFFCLPEMFENFERFNFGCRQNGERVEDVLLPAWCQRDSRLFTLIHRQALESEFVRNNLHNWIDLIFGFKQTGESAVEAINVFHPATYAVFLESEITDPIERKAVETMVKTYGQMPRQLFRSPHNATKPLNYCLGDKAVMQSVRGLRWGVYCGSPQLPSPTLGNIHKLPGAEYLVSFNNTNVVYGLPSKSCVMQGAESDTFNVISWGYDDRIVRIQPLNKLHAKPKNLLYNSGFDDITACGCDAYSNQLWFGHKSGRISVYKCTSTETQQRPTKGRQSYVRGLRLSYNSAFRKMTIKSSAKTEPDIDGEGSPNSSTLSAASATSNALGGSNDALHRDGADLSWCGPTVLIRHTDEITCISICVEFKIVVTAGRDGIAVIWDLNDWSYIRTIERPAEIHHSPVTHLAISPTLGDIVTVHTLPWQSDEADSSAQMKTQSNAAYAALQTADECFEVTEESLDDFVNVNINPNGKSILRLHSVNARYVQHIVHEDRILAICYSYIKEGVGVNVIATAVEGGIVRLWSSWNLSFVSEIITGISHIKSITYSTHQHMVVLTRESRLQVWETEGLYGSSPKFPQIVYK